MMKLIGNSGIVLATLLCLATVAQAQVNSGPISAGDILTIDVLRAPDISGRVEVDESGYIYLPFVGQIKLGGLSREQAVAVVGTALRAEAGMRNPRVSIQKSGRTPSGVQYGRTGDMTMAMIPLVKADATSLSQMLQGMSSPGGHIAAHAETNTLLITDNPEAIQNMMTVVDSLDKMQSQLYQVRIEARIAEVRVGALKDIGLRWFAQGTDVSGGFYPPVPQDPAIAALRGGLSPSAAERIGNTNSVNSIDNSGRRFIDNQFDRRFQLPVQVPLPGQSFLGISTGDVDIGAMLNALVSDNEAELLADPHTLTVNHKPALIKMIDRIPITELGVELSGATLLNVEFEEVGIVLNVTPHVSRSKEGCYVRLDMKAEVSFPTGQSINGIPIISERSIVSPAIVRDGETLVMGGITKDEDRKTVSKIPILGDLPVLGLLFKQKEKSTFRTELMIFVTPRVYTAPEKITWDEMIDVSAELREHSLVPASLLPENEDGE